MNSYQDSYERVRKAQLMGETTRDKWHNAGADDTGPKMELPMPEWLLSFDAEADAYQNYHSLSTTIHEEGYKLPCLTV